MEGTDPALDGHIASLAVQLTLGAAVILTSVTIQMMFLVTGEPVLLRAVRRWRIVTRFQSGLLTGLVVLWFFLAICIQCWLWALLFYALGTMETLEEALYFATVTFTTLGYGDVVIEGHWRLLSAFCAANGIIIIGLTTAIVFLAVQIIFGFRTGR